MKGTVGFGNVGRRSLIWIGVVAAIGSASSGALAQNLSEIVVTAERRETTLQRTPISVIAFNEESMELRGIETLEDIAVFTPNLDIKGSRGFGNASPTYQIRGLSGGGGAGGGGATGERSAALYVDGIFMPRTTGPFMSVLDVQRVEVLRGPQGTLFGRNSTGGAIRVFTQQPHSEREGHVRMSAGSFSRADLNAVINVPISDSVYFRAQGASLNQDGYVTRGTQELGGEEDVLGRLQLALVPNDNFRVTFGVMMQNSESDGNPQQLATFDMNPDLNYQGNAADWLSDFLALASQARLDPNNDQRLVLDDYTMPDWCFLDDGNPDWDPACEQTNESDYNQFSVNLNWQINQAWSFTSITGISDFSSEGRTDWVMVGTRVDPTNVESDMTYQEFQLTADYGPIDFVTGVSFFDEDSSYKGAILQRRGTSVYNGTGGTPGVPPDAVATSTFRPDGLFVTTDIGVDQATMSYGVFANLAWHLTDRFTVTPGIRYGYDEKEVTQVRFAADDFVPFAGSSTEVFAEDDWDETDYRLTLDYQITPNHMVYLTSSKAYRAGAYSYSVAAAPASGPAQTQGIADGTIAAFTPPESVENQELGFRTEWFNQRLRFNITYFDMAYSDRQGPVQVADPSQPAGFRIQTVDTGDVDLDGIEIEGQIAATERFTLDFSAGSVDSLVKDQCANNGEFLFPGPVEDSYTLGGRWSMPMQRGSNLTVMLSYAYTGPQQTHPGGTTLVCTNPITGAPNALPNSFFDSRYELPDYSLLNGRVRYTSTDGKWALTFFGNNLTDEVYGNYATRFGGGFWDSAIPAGVAVPQRSALGLTMGRPREYGITFDYNFGSRPQAE